MIKAVATDIDGTLTVSRNNYKLAIEAIKAIRLLEEHGIPVILISGNALPIVVGLSRYIGTSGPVLGENGCVIFYKGRKYYVTRETARNVAEIVYKELKDYVIYSWQNSYREIDYALDIRKEHSKNSGFIISKINEILHERGIMNIKVLFSGFAIHLVPKSCGKAEGLKFASKLLGVSLDEILGVGDGLNDVELLETVGFPATVSNADPELKKIAKYVASKPSGAGFSEIVEQILSGRLTKQ